MITQANGPRSTARPASPDSCVGAFCLLFSLLAIRQADATDFPVPDSGNTVSNGVALVAAINAAQAAAGDDVILLDAGVTYALDHVDNTGSHGNNGLPIITTGITIRGGYTPAGAPTTIARDGSSYFRIFSVSAAGRLKLDSLRIAKGAIGNPLSPYDYGSAVRNDGGTVHLFRSDISDSVDGTAISNLNAGSTGMMTIEESAVTNNFAWIAVAGIFNGGTLLIDRSTVSWNDGGAFHQAGNGGITSVSGDLRIVNSTVSHNVAGGGLSPPRGPSNMAGLEIQGGRASIEFSTIAMNQGLGVFVTGGTVTVANSILARNYIIDLSGGNVAAVQLDCVGTLTSGGHNIVASANSTLGNCGFASASTDRVGSATAPLDARLGPLAPNGGFTQTHALLAGSPAIAAADDSRGGCPPVDQRNELRPRFPETCDIGAYQTRISPKCSGEDGWCTLEPMALLCASLPNYCRLKILPGILKYIPEFPPLEQPELDCRIDGPGCGPRPPLPGRER